MRQPYLSPANLFNPDVPEPLQVWHCVRTKPKWDKKFSHWLAGNKISYYLPVFPKETVSHRKRRMTWNPLIPGYVFVQGPPYKQHFKESGCVLQIISPSTSWAVGQLHRDLWQIWKGLSTGSHMELSQPLQEGDWVQVSGTGLNGVQGIFSGWGNTGRLTLRLEMLGLQVSLELPENCSVRPVPQSGNYPDFKPVNH